MVISAVGLVAAVTLSCFGRERTLFGALLMAFVLPLASAPILLNGGVSGGESILIVSSFFLAYCAGIICVKAIIERTKRGRVWAGSYGLVVIALMIIGLLRYSLHSALAASVVYVTSVMCCLIYRNAKLLKRVGWTLMAASTLQAIWLCLAFR
jgi:hypothetical protein